MSEFEKGQEGSAIRLTRAIRMFGGLFRKTNFHPYKMAVFSKLQEQVFARRLALEEAILGSMKTLDLHVDL